MRFVNILRDPLTHFFAAGALLFIIISALQPAENNDRIIVDRGAMLSFMQYRSKAFEPQAAAAMFDGMSGEERNRLINDYIQEEALYREAKKLGLEGGDYVIRRRMVQKIEFMTEAAMPPFQTDDAALQAYYEQHRDDYYQQPGITFAHVYISTKEKPERAAITEAQVLLERMNSAGAKFEDATQYGDRFLFHTNYVERTFDYVRSHLGADATDIVFSDDTSLEQWIGPVLSQHGAHLIYVMERSPGRVPPLAEVKTQVTDDMAQAAREEHKQTLINAIVEKYAPFVVIDTPPAKQQDPIE